MAMKMKVAMKAAKAPAKAPKAAAKPAMKKAAAKSKSGMKKVMKVVKKAAKKPKSGMKKKSKKTSVIAKGKRAKSSVFRGTKEKTVGGLTKDKLKKNKSGKVVSKAKSDAAKKRGSIKHIYAWNRAFMAARKTLNIKGMATIKKGTKLYDLTKAEYTKEMKKA